MNYKDKITKPITTVDTCDKVFKLQPLKHGQKIKEIDDQKPATKKMNRSNYTNLDSLYSEIQTWFNDFLEDSLLTSSNLMGKHHTGETNAFPEIISLLESNITKESKTEVRHILNEKTQDEVLSD